MNHKLYIRKKLISECIHYCIHLLHFNADINTISDIDKFKYVILRNNHVIEKGMSLRQTRKDFGDKKVLSLIQQLQSFDKFYGIEDPSFLDYPTSTIAKFIEFRKSSGTLTQELEDSFSQYLRHRNNPFSKIEAGVSLTNKEDVINHTLFDFDRFVRSRHSIRYFSKTVPTKEEIEKALSLASHTPSACNRQGWKTHIFWQDGLCKLLDWQGGCEGFKREIPCAILVTENSKAFLHYEAFQAYVDGGFYAMSLVYALHSLGLGTIPLSCGFGYKKLKSLHQMFAIPDNEVPIVIIGVGHYEDTFKVAVSHRTPIERTNTFHELCKSR